MWLSKSTADDFIIPCLSRPRGFRNRVAAFLAFVCIAISWIFRGVSPCTAATYPSFQVAAAVETPIGGPRYSSAVTVEQQDWREEHWTYSRFVKEVMRKRVVSVTFSSDMRKLFAVAIDGQRHVLEALPNDPELLSILSKNKVTRPTMRPLTNAPFFVFASCPAVLLLSAGGL